MSSFLLLIAQIAHETHVVSAPGGDGFNWFLLFNPAVVWVLIPIVAILVGATAKIIQRSQEHRERMALIAAGLHPDYPPTDEADAAHDGDFRDTTPYRS
jgi:hypothetical protein